MYYRCEFFDKHKEIVPYADAWSWQKDIVKQRKLLIEGDEDFSDTLIILQHQPVYTLGSGSSEAYLNFDMKNAPFDVYRTERGGEVTYHGPGQVDSALICRFYLILSLHCTSDNISCAGTIPFFIVHFIRWNCFLLLRHENISTELCLWVGVWFLYLRLIVHEGNMRFRELLKCHLLIWNLILFHACMGSCKFSLCDFQIYVSFSPSFIYLFWGHVVEMCPFWLFKIHILL